MFPKIKLIRYIQAMKRQYCHLNPVLWLWLACVALLSVPLPSFGQVVINEFMARNGDTIVLPDGSSPDWIELYNGGSNTVDLTGWFLYNHPTNPDDQWEFPAVSLSTGEYLVVYASGDDQRDPAQPLHTNFKLGGDGEYLALLRPDGNTVEHGYLPSYPEQLTDVSFGISSNLLEIYRYFSTPTPGSVNGGEYEGLVADTKFSIDRGFYSNARRHHANTGSRHRLQRPYRHIGHNLSSCHGMADRVAVHRRRHAYVHIPRGCTIPTDGSRRFSIKLEGCSDRL
jgi:hypothetical protein